MSNNSDIIRYVNSVWWPDTGGKPVQRSSTIQDHIEKIRDGLLVFHNPYAKYLIDPEIFKIDGVVQVFADPYTRKFTKQINGACLMHRLSMNLQGRARV